MTRDVLFATTDFIRDEGVQADPRRFAVSPSRRFFWHDLDALAAQVRHEYFLGHPAAQIQWGKNTSRKKRSSIRLGSYEHAGGLIRIHPRLDSAAVPAYFIQSIIYHEYLHHILGPRHGRRFRARERKFRHYRESRRWLSRNLPMLLGHPDSRRSESRRERGRLLDPRTVLQLSLFE